MPLGRMPTSSKVSFRSSIQLLFVVGALIPTLEDKCNALGEVLSYLKITVPNSRLNSECCLYFICRERSQEACVHFFSYSPVYFPQ